MLLWKRKLFVQYLNFKMGLEKSIKEIQKPLDVNKQMLEIKKKIQLSEGRRKAAFEDCISEHKRNSELITLLKKTISELVVELHTLQDSSLPIVKFVRRLERTIGPVERKTEAQIVHLLDLQVTDRRKSADLVRFRIRQQQRHLTQLAERYSAAVSGKSEKEVLIKCDRPVRKSICELENAIHAVEVQLREANHIAQKYKDLKSNLEEDGARFREGIAKIEEELERQREEIAQLQKVLEEATRLRVQSRAALMREERRAIYSAHQRDRQTNEGRRLVTARQQELEMLEKRISQNRKTPVLPVAAAGVLQDQEAPPTDEEELNTPSEAPRDYLGDSLHTLKQATGCDDVSELSQCFVSQRDTLRRLQLLKKQTELEKSRKERTFDCLVHQLHQLKFTQDKDMESNEYKLNFIRESIQELHEKSAKLQSCYKSKKDTIEKISKVLQEVHLCVNPLAVTDMSNVLELLEETRNEVGNMMQKVIGVKEEVEELPEEIEEKWLPNYYSGLVRTTPLPQTGNSPQQQPQPQQGSEEEDEVPSRTYLKRQAQIVVDAKSRRKHAVRINAAR